jgi:hypothetical protein
LLLSLAPWFDCATLFGALFTDLLTVVLLAVLGSDLEGVFTVLPASDPLRLLTVLLRVTVLFPELRVTVRWVTVLSFMTCFGFEDAPD